MYLSIPFLCGNKRKLRSTDHPSTFAKLIDSHIAWLDRFVFLRPFCKYYNLTVIGNFFLWKLSSGRRGRRRRSGWSAFVESSTFIRGEYQFVCASFCFCGRLSLNRCPQSFEKIVLCVAKFSSKVNSNFSGKTWKRESLARVYLGSGQLPLLNEEWSQMLITRQIVVEFLFPLE